MRHLFFFFLLFYYVSHAFDSDTQDRAFFGSEIIHSNNREELSDQIDLTRSTSEELLSFPDWIAQDLMVSLSPNRSSYDKSEETPFGLESSSEKQTHTLSEEDIRGHVKKQFQDWLPDKAKKSDQVQEKVVRVIKTLPGLKKAIKKEAQKNQSKRKKSTPICNNLIQTLKNHLSLTSFKFYFHEKTIKNLSPDWQSILGELRRAGDRLYRAQQKIKKSNELT